MRHAVRERCSLARVRLSFGLRTLLIFVALLSLPLGIWSIQRECRFRAARHHYAALKAGYSAVRIQKPDSDEWNQHWRTYAKWPSPLRMDRAAIESALPLWRRSVRQAQLREHYLEAAHRPWMMFCPFPAEFPILEPPNEDRLLAEWWQSQFAEHVKNHGLNESWGTSVNAPMIERQCTIMNGAPGCFNDFFQLREIMPVEDGWQDEEERLAER
jgi:hypothetical protein